MCLFIRAAREVGSTAHLRFGRRFALSSPRVMQLASIDVRCLRALFARYRLKLSLVSKDRPIPGTHWGEPEAGLIGDTLYARGDTPIHSTLHEGAHFVCMDETRRRWLNTDAGGDAIEESAVCYLSVVLAKRVPGFGVERMLLDMDLWGYSFRLGSARRWFWTDAEDAKMWLLERGLLTQHGALAWD